MVFLEPLEPSMGTGLSRLLCQRLLQLRQPGLQGKIFPKRHSAMAAPLGEAECEGAPRAGNSQEMDKECKGGETFVPLVTTHGSELGQWT